MCLAYSVIMEVINIVGRQITVLSPFAQATQSPQLVGRLNYTTTGHWTEMRTEKEFLQMPLFKSFAKASRTGGQGVQRLVVPKHMLVLEYPC